jgi:hypothetical protein
MVEEMVATNKTTRIYQHPLTKIKNMGNKPLQNLNVPKQGMSKKNPSELENEYSLQ